MMWLVRFFGWATLFAVPSFLLMGPYQRGLAEVAMGLLAAMGSPVQLELRVQEPFNLGIFAAMCLASTRSPSRERVRAFLIGVPALALFGLFTVVIVIGGYRLIAGSHGSEDATTRWILSAIETIPWVSAPALWLVLLGANELKGSGLR